MTLQCVNHSLNKEQERHLTRIVISGEEGENTKRSHKETEMRRSVASLVAQRKYERYEVEYRLKQAWGLVRGDHSPVLLQPVR